jgi:hypothetical protein
VIDIGICGKNDLSKWGGFVKFVAARCVDDERLTKYFHSGFDEE